MEDKLFENLELDEKPEKEDSKIKKVTIFLVGLFLLILMFSYIFVTYPISGIIRGQLESLPLQESTIELDSLTIVFEEGAEDILTSLYLEQQDVEFSACLLGYKEEGIKPIYHITSLYQPEMYQQAFNHVSFAPCSAETVIMLHTHPYKSCLASETDLNTLAKTKKRNPNILMVIMCEPARFSIYQ